ncbi:hypothetical protein D9758_007664 [Tetrapyrgos nigripes]|uniref:Uncharacterized protein n=1 Tax=Tetrapyrgos nigripes TaxID=182062 RepID=A0A8H5LIS7_9AGAR|nr:hypothetical protein D9758_007664 [Tetrapyrgos nigripes]
MALFLKAACRSMERIAPLRLAEKWDNVGLLIESPVPKNTHRVMLTIDLTPDVVTECIAADASVIVSYHPPIFQALKSITLSNPLQASLLQCASGGISVFSPHTALDSVWGGVNDWLGKGLLENQDGGEITALVREKISPSGEVEGAEGRLVNLNTPVSVDTLTNRLKRHLGLSHVQVGYPRATDRTTLIRTIAVCAGSGGSMLLGTSADVYFTGEMGHHEVLAATAAGKHVILCKYTFNHSDHVLIALSAFFCPLCLHDALKGGHTNTERGYLPNLAFQLKAMLEKEQGFDDVEVIVSSSDAHPLHFV